jgi:NosR/NirI family transcriptional regulator, nitrous oxide reductase regulator
MPPRRSLAWPLRLYRLAIFALVFFFIHLQHQDRLAERSAWTPELATLQEFWPEAHSLSSRDPEHGGFFVLAEGGRALGYALSTAEAAAHIVGYSGPSSALLLFDQRGRVIHARLLHSADTADHSAMVERHAPFWKQFEGLVKGQAPQARPHGVTGATLTSSALAEGILAALDAPTGIPFLFPQPLTAKELQEFLPQAASLGAGQPGGNPIYDADGELLGTAFRSSPAGDAVIGYRGPSDVIAIFDPASDTLSHLRVRDSYDSEQYVGYVNADPHFLRSFSGLSRKEIIDLDYQAARIEGVSGATQTSYATIESIRVALEREASRQAERAAAATPWHPSPRDLGLATVLALGCLMSFSSLRGRPRLRFAYLAAVLVYLGFISGDMIAQALVVGWAQGGIPFSRLAGLALLVAASLLLPWLTGKQVYCHQICPHGAAQQLINQLSPWRRLARLSPPTIRLLSLIPLALLALVLAVAMLDLPVELAALEAFDAYLWRAAAIASIAIAITGLVASLFMPLPYCRFGCPTGLLFKFVRTAGRQDRFSSRDVAGLAFAAAAALLYFAN